MPRKIEVPKINVITFLYNGDQNKFKMFLSNMTADYMKPDNLHEYMRQNFVGCVDFSKTEAVSLDK